MKILFIIIMLISSVLSGCGNNDFNCHNNYIAEPAGEDYWQTEEETRRNNGGDCEDFAYIEYKKHKGAFMVVGTVSTGGHVWVETAKGETIDPCMTDDEAGYRSISRYLDNQTGFNYGNWRDLLIRDGVLEY